MVFSGTVVLQYIAVRYLAKSSISRIGHGSQIFHMQKKKKFFCKNIKYSVFYLTSEKKKKKKKNAFCLR